MLQDSGEASILRPGRGRLRRWSAVGLLILGAVAGLRVGLGPSPFETTVHAQERNAGTQKTSSVDLTHVPNDTQALFIVRPSEFQKAPEIKAALDGAVRDGVKAFTLLVDERIEQVAYLFTPGSKDQVVVLQFHKPTTFEAFAKAHSSPADVPLVTADTVVEPAMSRQAHGVVNDRTIVLGSTSPLVKYLGNRRKGEPLIASGPAWEKVRQRGIVAAVNTQLLREALKLPPGLKPKDPATSFLSLAAPLWTDSEFVVAGAAIEGDNAHVRAVATCQSAEQAEHVADTVIAAKVLAQNYLRESKENERNISSLAKAGIATATELLKGMKVEPHDKLVEAQTSAELAKPGTPAAKVLIEAISEARAAGKRTAAANKLKQIMLAMHIWADARKTPGKDDARLPPSVVLGRDGKGTVPHSWRVELLPYLGHEELYGQYNFDEPWDSETNKRVLEKMPDVFRDPADDPKSTTSAYYVLTARALLEVVPVPGIGRAPPEGEFPTAFSAKEGMPFTHITDGTANTIAVVEAKAGIPWTKPEDLLFDESKDLPKLGGVFKEGFHAGFCDGSVRFLLASLPPDAIKWMIMPGDGQFIP